MVDFTEVPNGETWEMFARDFLLEVGLHIESPPDRGADGGKDMLVTEELSGYLGQCRFRWLVSCKHTAHSGKAVGEAEEMNILERMESFRADGFLGFYSTLPSAGLNGRLRELRDAGRIRDYRIFDSHLIANYLLRQGYSEMMARYLPESHARVRPVHLITDEYIALKCAACGRDLLCASDDQQPGILAFVRPTGKTNPPGVRDIHWIYWACKGNCDDQLDSRRTGQKYVSSWTDIGDLLIPVNFLRRLFGIMNQLRNGSVRFSDEAFDQLTHFILALSQRTLRETTAREFERVNRLIDMESLWQPEPHQQEP